jgi:hypothetical protein
MKGSKIYIEMKRKKLEKSCKEEPGSVSEKPTRLTLFHANLPVKAD